jgi:hypothetical protein
MQSPIVLAGCLLALVLTSCGRPTEQSVTEVKNDAFKVDVRSQEFHDSGIRNVDVCVTDTNQGFPGDKSQCFLHGFDFSGLSVKWLSDRDVDISFSCGRVEKFSNFAIVSKDHPLPVEFHATLHEACKPVSNTASTAR